MSEVVEAEHEAELEASDEPWGRLSARVILADLIRTLLSLSPAGIAILFFNVEPTWSAMWPLVIVAAWGVLGSIADVMRWAFTWYRVTEHQVQRRTGIVTRRYRSVRRNRIRSVDTHAKLLHRLAGLRVVAIGAGQQNTAGESAFSLDALAKDDAARLRERLLRSSAVAARAKANADRTGSDPSVTGDAEDASGTADDAWETPEDVQVIATLQRHWVLFNMFSIWAYATAAGLLWGAYWLLDMFGFDPLPWVTSVLDPDARGWTVVVLMVLVVVGIFGAIGMAVAFITGYWKFELARVTTDTGSYLRTRRGLLSTREVNRDESRVRGLTISQPLLWRWMRMADTNVITTGLSLWSSAAPSALVPRGPLSIAQRVSTEVLGEQNPLLEPVRRHPARALRRRLWWATLVAGGAVALVAWPVAAGAAPLWVLWIAVGLWPVALLAAVVAYRALGHTLTDEHLVVRAGLMSRHHSALRRDAVSTIAVRQSVLQRRLGLATVSAMTSAGWFAYEAPDLEAADAVDFAVQAAPDLLEHYRATP